MAGQVEVSRAKENVNKRDMARKLDSNADDDEEGGNVLAATGAGAGAGALIGAGIGSIVPVIGTAVGAAVGALIGTAVGAIGGAIAQSSTGASDEKENAALESLEKAYLEDDTILQKLKDGSMTEADWDKLEIDDTTLRASLEANADEVAELV
jgi:phage tail tape-measure protein